MPQSRPTSVPHTETSVGFPKAKAAVQERDLERLSHSVTVQLLGTYQGTPVFTGGARQGFLRMVVCAHKEAVPDQSGVPGTAEVMIRRVRTCQSQFVLLSGTFLRKTPPRKDQRTRLQWLNTLRSVLYMLQFSPTLCYKSPPRVAINLVDRWPYSSQE